MSDETSESGAGDRAQSEDESQDTDQDGAESAATGQGVRFTEQVRGWFEGRLPDGGFTGPAPVVDGGGAPSRSDALAWCVRLTGEHADAWLTELRNALLRVEEVRAQG